MMSGRVFLDVTTFILASLALSACTTDQSAEQVAPIEVIAKPDTDASYEAKLKAAAIDPSKYPSPPEPHYGPAKGSISFVDTDPGPTIGGTLKMRPAVDENGKRVDEAANGITKYMIHWGLEVGEPGTQDDAGAGDFGGDCMGFRDTGHIVMKPASEADDIMTWEIPQGTAVPEGAVYFVGHTLYGRIHNLGKCTQAPIDNRVG